MSFKVCKEKLYKFYTRSKHILFPLALVLFALLKVNQGVDLTDASYSLGNYRFFRESSGSWFLLTFFSNVAGFLMTLLPFGKTMLGMKVYTSLVIALMGCLSFRFFMTKMPAWLAFLAEVLAIGMCWAPSTILYHYLTYLFFLLGGIFLFRGLAGKKNRCLILAGVFLGINVFVRFPGNLLEVSLILALWVYCYIEHIELNETIKKTFLCVGGFLIGLLLMTCFISMVYGLSAVPMMIQGFLGISSSASDYTFGQMLLSIADAYWHGAKWGIYMVICTILGVPFFLLYNKKYLKIRKLAYCLGILFLFFVLGRWGMYNFKYYQKESALQWGALFLLISIGVCIWIFITKQVNNDWKLIGWISLIMILITPLGSNNYIWPVLNNLFFIAPVTFWIIYRFARWGRGYLDLTSKVPLYAVKAMLSAVIIAFFIQAVGVGLFYVFIDGEDGVKRAYTVENNDVLAGMKTNQIMAENLTSISEYFNNNSSELEDKAIILYGNIPGLSYYLDKPSAINTTWSDLDSNPIADMEAAIKSIDTTDVENRPVAVWTRECENAINGETGMDYLNTDKLNLVNEYINRNGYNKTFENDMFVVYE